MKHLIILLESLIIVLYIDSEYKNTTIFTQLNLGEQKYTSYYSLDIIENKILTLENVQEKDKVQIWKDSFIKEEVLEFFPNMEVMKEVYNDRVSDNGVFKEKFFEYMVELQDSYIGGELDEEGFKKAFSNPPF